MQVTLEEQPLINNFKRRVALTGFTLVATVSLEDV